MVDGNVSTTPEKGGDVLWVERGREAGNGRNGRRPSVGEKTRLEMVTSWPGTCNFF